MVMVPWRAPTPPTPQTRRWGPPTPQQRPPGLFPMIALAISTAGNTRIMDG